MSAIQFGTSGKSYVYSDRGDRHILRTVNGVVYIAIVNYTDSKLEMWKSTGGSFSKVGTDPTCYVLGSCAAVIGSGNPQLIHVLFYSNSTTVKYVTFNTSTDAWGTPETIDTFTAPAYYACSISLDSANVPHVVYHAKITINTVEYNKLKYANRTSGSWQVPIVVEASFNEEAATRVPSITIDTTSGGNHRTDIPQISYIQSTNGYLQAALGNGNNATAFTVVRPATKSATAGFTCIAIDSNGRTIIAYLYFAAGAYTQIVYVDAENTWNTVGNWINKANITGDANGLQGSLFISGATCYLLTPNSTTGIRYHVSTNSDLSVWETAVTIEAGTYSNPCARNQYANDPKSSLDYLFRDASNYVYFNTFSLTANNTGNFMVFFRR